MTRRGRGVGWADGGMGVCVGGASGLFLRQLKWRESENFAGGGSFSAQESALRPISASQACSRAPWEVWVARCWDSEGGVAADEAGGLWSIVLTC